jgi:CRISPR/Cas system-associated exonuclease Cas4 (RecB family)
MDKNDGGIEWSYSNAMRYDACPRSLFYHYWQHQREEVSEVGQISSDEFAWYSSPGALIGTAVHEGISAQIERWSRGQPTSRDEAHRIAHEVIEISKESQLSKGGLSESQIDSLTDTATDHLDRFLSVMWPQIRSGRYILHEQSRQFLIEGMPVWVRPDLCHRDQDRNFVVTDWKTRQPEVFEDHSLQLQAYALWATSKFEPDIEKLQIQLGFTGTGEIRSLPVTTDILADTRERIRTDIDKWSQPSQQSGFPTKPELEKCQSCSYLSACPDGQEICKET